MAYSCLPGGPTDSPLSIRNGSLLLSGLLLTTACHQPDGVDGTVIVLVMDGVRTGESFGDDPSSATGEYPSEFMPRVWTELMPQGVRAPRAWNLGATTTTPAHVNITSGRRQTFANYPVGDDIGVYQPELPSVFDEVRSQLDQQGEALLLVSNSDRVRPVSQNLWPGSEEVATVWVPDPDDEELPSDDDSMVLEFMEEHLANHPVRFALANLHQIDRTGHYGHEQAYPKDVKKLDGPLVGFWAWLQERPDYRDDTWLVILADHGRHEYDVDGADPVWRNHGCNCNGCRHVPLLLLGPDVAAGQDVVEPVLLTDLAPTLAARLGVELPWASGLVRDDLFEGSSGIASRTGVADFAMSGELTAELRYQDDPAHRSALWLAGQRLSDPDAVEVAAPALTTEGDQAWACFREVVLTPEEADTTWQGRCFESSDGGASWDAMPTPWDAVGPYWEPALIPDGTGGLLAAWIDNLHGNSNNASEESDRQVTFELGHYASGAWSQATLGETQTFPTDLVLVRDGEQLLVAAGAAPTGNLARHSRDVFLGRATFTDEGLAWQGLSPADLSELTTAGSRWRLERPALRLDGSKVSLAAIGHDEAGSHAVLAQSTDEGASIEEAQRVAFDHDIDPHVSPVWLDATAVWVAVSDSNEASWLCAATLEGEARCTSTGAVRIQHLQPVGDTLWALVDPGTGSWELEHWGADEL